MSINFHQFDAVDNRMRETLKHKTMLYLPERMSSRIWRTSW